MGFSTGRSAAKRHSRNAKRLAKELRRRRKYLERTETVRASRGLQGGILAATSAYGLPGVESSGVQAIQGQVISQTMTSYMEAKEFEKMENEIRDEIRRAKKAASRFKTMVTVAAGVTGGVAGAAGAAGAVAGASLGYSIGSTVSGGMMAGSEIDAMMAGDALGGPYGRGIGGFGGGAGRAGGGWSLPSLHDSTRGLGRPADTGKFAPNINQSPFAGPDVQVAYV